MFLASSCAKGPAKVARSSDVGAITSEAISLGERMLRYRDRTRSIKALAWVTIGDGEEERQTETAMAILRPEGVRVDAMDALADVWARAGTDGRVMWLNIPAKSKLYSGKASAKNLYRLAKFDFELPELLDVISGSPPIPSEAKVAQVGDRRDGHFIVQGSGVHLWTDKKSRLPVRVARLGGDGSSVEYTVTFGDYRRVDDVDFPHRIEAQFPSRGARIVIVYKEVKLGGAVDPNVFLPPAPADKTRVHSLDKP